MTKPISRQVHGFIEHNYIAAVANAPRLAGFEDDAKATFACRAFSAGVLATSVFTRAEWGFVRVIPYKAHLTVDLLSSVAALGMPWLLGFAGNTRARNTFLAMGISGLVVGLLSEPEEMP